MPHLITSLALATALLLSARAVAADRAPDPARVRQWAQMLPATSQGVGRPITDRQAWQALAQLPAFQKAVAQAQKLCSTPIPAASDDLYLEFSRNGNRTRYQSVLSQRHSRFALLTLAECIENQGRFLPAIEEAIRAVCSEKTWVLPAHDRNLQNFKGKLIDIDLNSSATSWNLATACYWLGDKLSPQVRTLVQSELERRTFTPMESYIHSGKPAMWWPVGTNNWNAVCLAGVTGTALAAVPSPQRRALFAASAEKLIVHFLEGFTSDGYCSEGIGYWNYGFGHFLLLSETLRQASDGKVDLLQKPQVESIARFARRMEILPGVYPAFADCHLNAQPEPELMAVLSRRFGWGLRDIEARNSLSSTKPDSSLFRLGLLRFANSATSAPALQAKATAQPLRDWFDQAGILICRPAPASSHALGVALKGGHNAENHNHNDVGSFVVALGHDTPLVDPGSEVYTARTFGPDRYKSLVLNSFGHPVPLVAGQLERTGRSAQAKVLKTEFTEQADILILDIRSAYGVKELEELTRTFVFSRTDGGRLTVTDHVRFATPQKFGTALVTFDSWKQSGDQLVIGKGQGGVAVQIDTNSLPIEIHAQELHEDLPDKRIPTRLGIDLRDPVPEATLTLTIRPAP